MKMMPDGMSPARGPAPGSTLSPNSCPVPSAGLSVCIVAYKDLRLNTRVARQAAALTAAGHAVTVVGFAAPALAEDGAPAPVVVATGVPSHPKSLMTLLDIGRHVLPLPRGAGIRLGAAMAVRARRGRSGGFARMVA
ncbi:MAG: hypothetical protein WA184_10250, partial [Stellaceae bacterium]